MRTTPTIFVCDDDEELRIALHFMLKGKGFTVATYGSGPELLEAVDAMDKPVRGVFVLDVDMAPMRGPEVHAQLRARGFGDKNPIAFLTGKGSIRLAADAVKLGALDFIEKDEQANSRLVDLLHQALALEEQWQHKARRNAFLREMWESLTPQQRRVARKAASGTVQRVIAEEMNIGVRMVEVHLDKAKSKLGVDVIPQLTATLIEIREAGIDTSEVADSAAAND